VRPSANARSPASPPITKNGNTATEDPSANTGPNALPSAEEAASGSDDCCSPATSLTSPIKRNPLRRSVRISRCSIHCRLPPGALH
jgi:hypothetical protein